MKLLRTSTRVSRDDQIGRGMDAVIVLALFLGGGYLLDRWLGTTPLFMIVMVMVGAVGIFVQLRYRYEATMREHEAALDEARRGRAA